MKQIFNFEKTEPPIINEAKLKKELKKRNLKRLSTVLYLIGFFAVVLAFLSAVYLYEALPAVATMFFIYVVLYFLFVGIYGFLFLSKRRRMKCSRV